MNKRAAYAPAASWAVCLSAAGLAACGGGGGTTPQQQIAQLEASGVLPVLDRTDSLAGIDANGNGVRDDIERYIEGKYTEPAQRRVAMQTAKSLQQKLLVDVRDEAALYAVSAAGMRAVQCRRLVIPGVEAGAERSRMSRDLEAMTTNTKQRLLAYLAYNKTRSGSVSTIPEGDTCD